MQTDNRIFDGFAKLFTDAAGAAQSLRQEVEAFMKSRMERLVADMDLVSREEFEAVKMLAAKARAENEKLEARLVALETKLGSLPRKTRAARSDSPSQGPRKL